MTDEPTYCCAGTPMRRFVIGLGNGQPSVLEITDESGCKLWQMYCPACGTIKLVPRKDIE